MRPREVSPTDQSLANLDKILRPTGFKVAGFPIKVQGASGGW